MSEREPAQDDSSPRPAEADLPESDDGGHRARAIVFGVMLFLALVGMALSMSLTNGPWEFWVVVLLVYAGVSVAWEWQKARKQDEPVARTLRLQLLHWGSVLVCLCVLLLFDRTDILSRQAASTTGLLVLALGCLLAGVHFEWTFLLLGAVLAGMTVAIAYLEQYLAWLVMVPVLVAAGWAYVQLHLRARRDRD